MVSNTIITAISLLFRFLELAILIDVVMSWMAPDRRDSFTNFIHSFTEPLMNPAKKIQNKIAPDLMIDFSPIFAFIILDLLKAIIFAILKML